MIFNFGTFVICFIMLGMKTSSVSAAGRPSVLSFGDSWAYGNYYGLRDQFRKRNLTDVQVTLVNQFGSTAKYFSDNTNLLPDAVRRSRADYVLLSLGGNDLKNFYFEGDYVMPWTASKRIQASITKVLEALYKEYPKVKVVMYGYDFLGRADEYIFTKDSSAFKRGLYKYLAVPLSNYVATFLSSTLRSVEKHFRKQGFSVTYVPLWGTLQHVLDEEEKRDRKLGFSYWKHSAEEYMQDPIHANAKGYSLLMGRLFDEYFAKELAVQNDPDHQENTARGSELPQSPVLDMPASEF